MNQPHGIVIFGANGSGKTTLGRELAHMFGFKHIDHEDYAFICRLFEGSGDMI